MDRIETERLVIRPYTRDDADFVVAGLGNLDVSRWLTPIQHPFTHADLKLFGPDGESRWPDLAAIEGPSGAIGGIGGGGHLGYWLLPAAQGQGFGTEAARAMVDYSFQNRDIERIEAGCFQDNPASICILNKLGFVVVAETPALCRALGEKRAAWSLELSRSRWEARR